jgi:hypothetical protein
LEQLNIGVLEYWKDKKERTKLNRTEDCGKIRNRGMMEKNSHGPSSIGHRAESMEHSA